jgi:hypothetical protein
MVLSKMYSLFSKIPPPTHRIYFKSTSSSPTRFLEEGKMERKRQEKGKRERWL